MKKIILIVFTVFLNTIIFSCTDEPIEQEVIEETQACCGEEGPILPPPPPPPPPTGGN